MRMSHESIVDRKEDEVAKKGEAARIARAGGPLPDLCDTNGAQLVWTGLRYSTF